MMTVNQISFLLIILNFFLICSCNQKFVIKLLIVSPGSTDTTIIQDFSLANYGAVPYGKTIYSQIRLASPKSGCSSLTTAESDIDKQIVMVHRSGCTFLQKTKMAELSGAKMLLIVDNNNEDEEAVVMIADYSSITHIPTIMITFNDGQNIVESIALGADVILSVTFPKPEVDYIAHVDFWLASLDIGSYEFLKQVQDSTLIQLFSSNVAFQNNNFSLQQIEFTPYYVIWYCAECQTTDYKEIDPGFESSCIFNGRYPDPDRTAIGNGPLEGKDAIYENWRQLCIYHLYNDQVQHNFAESTWLKYMLTFYENCLQTQINDLEQCSNEVMKIVNIDQIQVKQCMEQGIANPNQKNSEVQILEEQKRKFIEEEILSWPSLFINKLYYKGDLNSNETIDMICQSIIEEYQPEQCKKTNKSLQDSKDHISWTTVLIILFGIAIFMIVFYIFYKRQIQKSVSEEVIMQTNAKITQYFAFQDQKQ